MVVPFLLIFPFVLLLCFGGYTGGWRLFDCWWSGGAVISGALLFSGRPVRFHLIGVLLIPVLAMLMISFDQTGAFFQHAGWWIIAVFLSVFIPTMGDGGNLPSTLYAALRWCAAGLVTLYVIQHVFSIPVHGFGMTHSAEVQILLGALASALFMPRNPARWVWMGIFLAGIFWDARRSGILGLSLILACFLWLTYRRSRAAILVVTLGLMVVAALTVTRIEDNPHAERRLSLYLLSSQIFTDHPFGAGLDSFMTESLSRNFPSTDPRELAQYAKVPNHAHNVFLQWAALGGIVGLAAALALVAGAWMFLLHKVRSTAAGWEHRAALAWAMALIVELCLNVTESLSFVRWMLLVGIMALTPEFSVTLLPRCRPAFRLVWILVGAGLLYAGINDLFARQAILAGRSLERRGMLAEAAPEFQEAAERRPWDVQPHLHRASVALAMGRGREAEEAIAAALSQDEAPGTSRYFGALFSVQLFQKGLSDTHILEAGRYLMRSVSDLHSCDAPTWLECAAFARTESERIWRLKRVLWLEPRAAAAYDELAASALRQGDAARAERYREFAADIRRRHGDEVRAGLSRYSPFRRNDAHYEAALLRRTN